MIRWWSDSLAASSGLRAIFSLSWDTGEKWLYSEAVYQLFIDDKKASGSVNKEVLYSILTEIPVKLVTLIEICLNETYSKVIVVWFAYSFYKYRNYLKNLGGKIKTKTPWLGHFFYFYWEKIFWNIYIYK
jgi:hypothetical protein